jgi:hypothetical protein
MRKRPRKGAFRVDGRRTTCDNILGTFRGTARKEQDVTKKEAKKKAQDDAERQRHVEDLMNRCMIFTDRKGKVLDKGSHPFSSWLKMKYAKDSFTIVFSAQQSPYSNGSCSVRVKRGRKVLLDASGNYMAGPFGVKAKTYIPGSWEEKIPPAPQRER